VKFCYLSLDISEHLVYNSAFLISRKEPTLPATPEFTQCKAVLVVVDKYEIPELMGNRKETSLPSSS